MALIIGISTFYSVLPMKVQSDRISLILKSLRVRLDVDIEDLGIEFDQIPNQTSFGNGSQCQSDCLDVDELLDRNQRDNKYQIVFGWACRQIQN